MRRFKQILSLALVCAVMMSLAACKKNFNAVERKEFEDALENVLGLDDDEYHDYGDYYDGSKHDIDYWDDDVRYEFIEFKDEDDAVDFFEDYYYDDFTDVIEDEDFKGKQSSYLSDTMGYIIVNGEADSDFSRWDDDVYGGIYMKDGIVVIVMAYSDKNSDIKDVDEFLDYIGYPNP